MSARNRGGPGGSGHDRRGPAQTQRIASGARAAPYARPGGPSRQASSTGPTNGKHASQQQQQQQQQQAQASAWPPNQISIKGASGPTWVVVSNLVLGVSEADIRETFQQFGQIEGAHMRKTPAENQSSQAFEMAFTHAESAKLAIEKLNGALADGRVLQVFLRDGPKNSSAAAIQPQPKASAAQRDLFAGTPAALHAGGTKAPPSGPRVTPATAKRDLLLGRTTDHNGNGKAGKKAAAAPSSAPLQSRILSAQELKSLARQQAKTRQAPSRPNQPSEASLALAKRIGSLPLAQRLAVEAERAAPKSNSGAKASGKGQHHLHAAGASTNAKKRAVAAARNKKKAAGKAGGMDVDG